MTPNIKFYKIKLLQELMKEIQHERVILLDELIDNAIDPVIFKRRIRMMRHLNMYENQIIQKIQDFDTEDVQDFEKVLVKTKTIVSRSA